MEGTYSRRLINQWKAHIRNKRSAGLDLRARPSCSPNARLGRGVHVVAHTKQARL